MSRKLKLFALSVAMFVALWPCVGCRRPFTIPERPEAIDVVPPVVELKKPEQWTLPNGLTVMYLENKELPLVEGSFLFRGGSLYQGQNRAGLASATGQLLREGGVQGIEPEVLDRSIESLGATIESQLGDESGSVQFSGLQSDFDTILEHFARVIRTPAFDARRFELWQSLALEGIRRRDEEPDRIAQTVYRQVLYGLESPFAGVSTESSVRALTPDDLRTFYQSIIRPNGSVLVVTGAVSREAVERAVEREFGDWQTSVTELPTLATPPSTFQPGIYIVEKDFEQAAIYGGHFGPKRLSPDHYKISVFNRYLSGAGFGSLLFSKIRSQQGLAYAVDGGFNPGFLAGDFDVYVGTRVQEAGRVIALLLELLEGVQHDTPDPILFQEVIESAQNAFVFQFATPQAIAARAAILKLLDYPKDYDQTYIPRLEQVRPDDVRDVARRLVKPNGLALVVVGKVQESDLVSRFGGKLPVYRVRFKTIAQAIERIHSR